MNQPIKHGRSAGLLTRRLVELHDSGQIEWKDVGVYFALQPGSRHMKRRLKAQVSLFVTVAGRGFYDRPEIRDLLNITARALADPTDDLAMAGLLRFPAFALSDTALYQLRWKAESLVPFRAALNGDLSALAPADRLRAQHAHEAIDDLDRLVNRISVAELLQLGPREDALYGGLAVRGGGRAIAAQHRQAPG